MIGKTVSMGDRGGCVRLGGLLGSASAMALTLAAPSAAHAQTASPPGQIAEVVVTAQKRSTNLESTPISITAETGAQLERAGVGDITTALLSAPSVAFVSAGPGKTVYNIRGLSSNGGAAPTVGFYLDETPISSPVDSTNGKVAIDPTLYDLAEVEVLRGPQGTLYGAGSMGGTIKLETRQPNSHKFDASAEVIGSSTDHGGLNGSVDGMVNLPLIEDKLALRIVATEKHYDGYIDRIVTPGFPQPTTEPDGSLVRGDLTTLPVSKTVKNVNTEDTQALRVAVKFDPTERLSLTGSAFLQYTHQDGSPLYDNPPGTLAHYQPADVAEPSEDRFGIYNLLVNYDAGPVKLLSSTSYTRRYTSQIEDTTEEYNYVFGTGAYIPAQIQETHPSSQFSEELRVTSATKGPFQWLGGVFYSYSKDSYRDTSQLAPYLDLFGTANVFTYDEPDVTKQYAVFGEASYQIFKTLQATVGLRYFSYTNAFDVNQSGLFVPDIPSVEQASGTISATGVTPKFSLSWTPTDKSLIYATAAKGFRPGAENLPLPIGDVVNSCSPGLQALGYDGEPGAYKADSVWSYELGQKSRWMSNRLVVNSSVFYIDWSQVQQEVFLGCGYHFTANQGNAVSKGGETEITYLLTDALKFNGGFGYTDATLQQNTASGGVKGEQLQDVPKWTANAALEYTRPVTDRIDFIGRASFEYIGESHDRGEKPAYDIVGLRTGLEFSKFAVFLYADNVFDSRPIVAYSNALGVNIPDVDRLTTIRPRTIGIDLQYHY